MDSATNRDTVIHPEAAATAAAAPGGPPSLTSRLAIAGAWLAIGLPLLWGIGETFSKVMALFRI